MHCTQESHDQMAQSCAFENRMRGKQRSTPKAVDQTRSRSTVVLLMDGDHLLNPCSSEAKMAKCQEGVRHVMVPVCVYPTATVKETLVLGKIEFGDEEL